MLKTILIVLVIIYLVIGIIMLVGFAFLYHKSANDIANGVDTELYERECSEFTLNHIRQTHSIFEWLHIGVLMIVLWPYIVFF